MQWLDIFSEPVELTEERWQHIVTEHPEVHGHQEKIPTVLADPEYVKRSKRDEQVRLYYRYFDTILNGKYLLVVVETGATRSFVLTGYLTDSIKKGETGWEKH